MKKPVFYTELAWLIGLWLLAWGTALTAWADLGISMVVAPAYVLHLAMSDIWPWFTFGIGEYVLQATVLVIIMILLRKMKLRYFLSFLVAIFYGFILDLGMAATGRLLPETAEIPLRIAVYVAGDLAVCSGIALILRSYLPPEVYELFVKEVAALGKLRISTVKTLYDCTSLVVAVLISLALLGKIEGIGIATVICAFVNGFLIDKCGVIFDKILNFRDILPLRPKFEEGVTTYE